MTNKIFQGQVPSYVKDYIMDYISSVMRREHSHETALISVIDKAKDLVKEIQSVDARYRQEAQELAGIELLRGMGYIK